MQPWPRLFCRLHEILDFKKGFTLHHHVYYAACLQLILSVPVTTTTSTQVKVNFFNKTPQISVMHDVVDVISNKTLSREFNRSMFNRTKTLLHPNSMRCSVMHNHSRAEFGVLGLNNSSHAYDVDARPDPNSRHHHLRFSRSGPLHPIRRPHPHGISSNRKHACTNKIGSLQKLRDCIIFPNCIATLLT